MPDLARALHRAQAALDYDPPSRTAILGAPPPAEGDPRVAVVTAGTSDLPVGREALRTLAFYGVTAREIADVGVPGSGASWSTRGSSALPGRDRGRRHGRLFGVVAGLVGGVVVAVPTSTGYGAARFGGTALHARWPAARPAWSRSTSTTATAPCPLPPPRSAPSAGITAPRRRIGERTGGRVAIKAQSRPPFSPPSVELWIPITIGAAFFQNLRSALQKHLKGGSATGATFSRFAYAPRSPWLTPCASALLAGRGAGPNPTFAPRAGRRPRPDHRDGAASVLVLLSPLRGRHDLPRPRRSRPRSSAF